MITVHRVISCEAEINGEQCDAYISDDQGGEPEAELRARAEAEGWHRTDDDRDICDPCWKEGAR